MAYNANIPAANDLLSVSQGQIKDNFTELQTVIQINHVAFGSGDQGKHKFLQMPEQGSAPTTAANEGGLYCKQGTGSVTQLFFRRESSGSELEMTGASLAASGWSYLPSGLIMQWGLDTVSTNGTAGTQITFPKTFATACYSVTLTQRVTGGGVYDFFAVVGTPSTTSFYAKPLTASGGTTSNKQCYWIAVGV